MTDIKQLCADLRAGLEGVTPGPWTVDPMPGPHHPRIESRHGELIAVFGNAERWIDAKDEWDANANHTG